MSLTIEQQIGERLKKLRIKAGYNSSEKFAIDHELSRSQYQLYEKGGAKMRIDTLAKLAKLHNLTLSQFLKGIE